MRNDTISHNSPLYLVRTSLIASDAWFRYFHVPTDTLRFIQIVYQYVSIKSVSKNVSMHPYNSYFEIVINIMYDLLWQKVPN